MNITDGFRVVMKRHGVSSNDIAKKLNISNRAVNKAIGSKAIKKVDVISEYCNAIGCEVSELMKEVELLRITPINRMKDVNLILKSLPSDRFPCIYHLKNEFGVVVYVGQTICLHSRIMCHRHNEQFFSLSYRATDNNLDDEEMSDIVKFDPVLNKSIKSTPSNPSTSELKQNIIASLDCVVFNESITRPASYLKEKAPSKIGLITKEKHDFIISEIKETVIESIRKYDLSINESEDLSIKEQCAEFGITLGEDK